MKAGRVISICPEMADGLETPREPAEIQYNKTAQDILSGQSKILTIRGEDV